MREEEKRYRVPRRREKRTLAEEVSKFSLCFALSEHRRAVGGGGGGRALSGMDVPAIKAAILGGSLRAGDEVEGAALASPFAAVMRPRAYYPPYLLGEMRAALRRGEDPPAASPHYLPVSALPPLPDGSRITFLFRTDKAAFERPDFPAHVRDVFTRAYPRLPLLLPPQGEAPRGRVRFRARLLRVDRDTAYCLSRIGEDAYDAYSTRGLTYFLQPVEVEACSEPPPLRGSLFAELRLEGEPGWERMTAELERLVRGAAEEVFPPCPRGEREEPGCYLPHSGFHVTRFRRRLFALVYDPVIVVYRVPALLGLYLPAELMGGYAEAARLFEAFLARLVSALREGLRLDAPPRVETAYDNRLAWARDGGALRGPSFAALEEEYPFLAPTLHWLRGD